MSANKTQHIKYFATLLKMKRDKWFLNSPSKWKWNMLKGVKNIYDWYLILTFPTAIFLKVHAHYRHELVFSGDFQGQEGVCIMHQCALYNPKYGMYMDTFNIENTNFVAILCWYFCSGLYFIRWFVLFIWYFCNGLYFILWFVLFIWYFCNGLYFILWFVLSIWYFCSV